MNEPMVESNGHLEHPEVHFEPTDASFRSILFVLIGIAVVGMVVHLVISFFFVRYREHEARVKQSTFPLAKVPSTALPPEPRLEQVDRLAGVETPNVYKRESVNLELLHSYGPTEEEGFIRIPIDHAMQLLTNKLPTRTAPSPEERRRAGGLVDAGESNSGRMFRRRSP